MNSAPTLQVLSDESGSSDSADARPWAVVVLASREKPETLWATVQALLKAATSPATIDVLVNGNRALANELCGLLKAHPVPGGGACVRVWFLALGDKANTWNQYVHDLWPGARFTFFVDGYAVVAANALGLLVQGLEQSPAALAATGVPSSGRSAAKLRSQALQGGHLHGNLFVLRQGVMREMRQRAIRLPLGLYGYDGLIGALMAFALDPSRNDWDAKNRILVVGDVTWTHDALRWWRLSDLQTHFNRSRKRALRLLVVSAVRDFLAIRRQLPEQMPLTTAELVLAWAEQHPDELRDLLKESPASRVELEHLRMPKDWGKAGSVPDLLWSGGAG